MTKALVIGAGPAGLATAACLKLYGVEAEILERAGHVGASWHKHYDSLTLHTERRRSGLPHYPMPKAGAKFPTRNEVIAYLEDYAAHFELDIQYNTDVTGVTREGGGWRATYEDGHREADAIVFSTGLNGVAHRGTVPGLDRFVGPVLHSSEYRSSATFSDQHVLVVGFGNSGGDIALDLSNGGAHPILSVRSPVNILPFRLFGIPVTSLGGLRKLLPYRIVDALTAPILRFAIGRPEDYGLVGLAKGPAAQVIEDGRVPIIDHGALAAIKAGHIDVRGGIHSLERESVRFLDGAEVPVQAIILATGYRVDLRPLLPGALDALDKVGRPRVSGGPGPVPGIYFCSYRASPDGQLRQCGIDAETISKDIASRFGAP